MEHNLLLINLVHRSHDGHISSIPQLGLLYIATAAKNAGIASSIFHTDTPLSDIESHLEKGQDFLIGFYCNSDNLRSVLKACDKLKNKHASKNLKIILGGPIASLDYEKLIHYPSVDFICRGDGEELTVELIRKLNSKDNNFEDIEGLSFKRDGAIVHCKTRNFKKDLDGYPIPERSLYPTITKNEKMCLSTSRGCGFRCTFCFESIQRTIRYHSIERVIEEIKYLLSAHSLKYVSFTDDVFTTNHRRLEEVCEAIKNNFKPFEEIFWYCEARVDSLARKPYLVDLMKDAGLARIQIGTESGSQKVIDAYQKKITIEQIICSVEKLNEAKVQSIFTNFILGGPFDSEEIFQQTLDLMKRLHEIAPGRFESSCCFLSPYPGTDIHSNPDRYGLNLIDVDFYTDLSGCYVCTETLDFSKQDLLEKYKEFNECQNEQMFIHVQKISFDLIREHLFNSLQGLKTQWAVFLILDEVNLNWLNLIKTQKYTHKISNHPPDEVRKFYPQRTFPLLKVRNGTYTWAMLGREIRFSYQENYLVELFSGKLTFEEISEMVFFKYRNDSVSKETIYNDILSYAGELAEMNLVVFKHKE